MAGGLSLDVRQGADRPARCAVHACAGHSHLPCSDGAHLAPSPIVCSPPCSKCPSILVLLGLLAAKLMQLCVLAWSSARKCMHACPCACKSASRPLLAHYAGCHAHPWVVTWDVVLAQACSKLHGRLRACRWVSRGQQTLTYPFTGHGVRAAHQTWHACDGFWRAQVLDRVRLAPLLQVQAIMALCIAFMEVRAPSHVPRSGSWGKFMMTMSVCDLETWADLWDKVADDGIFPCSHGRQFGWRAPCCYAYFPTQLSDQVASARMHCVCAH